MLLWIFFQSLCIALRVHVCICVCCVCKLTMDGQLLIGNSTRSSIRPVNESAELYFLCERVCVHVCVSCLRFLTKREAHMIIRKGVVCVCVNVRV